MFTDPPLKALIVVINKVMLELDGFTVCDD